MSEKEEKLKERIDEVGQWITDAINEKIERENKRSTAQTVISIEKRLILTTMREIKE